MNDKILKILENRNIKPTSNRMLVLKAMLNLDWAFTLADLENELISVDKSTISRTIHLFRHQQLIHSFDDDLKIGQKINLKFNSQILVL